ERNVESCALPIPIKAQLTKRLTKMAESGQAITEDVIVSEIRDEVEAYGKVFEGKITMPAAGLPRFELVKSTQEQFTEALDDFFGVKAVKNGDAVKYVVDPNARMTSFRNLYIQFTGDQRVSGEVREAVRLSESLNSGSFTKALGDSITRRMVAEYQLPE